MNLDGYGEYEYNPITESATRKWLIVYKMTFSSKTMQFLCVYVCACVYSMFEIKWGLP